MLVDDEGKEWHNDVHLGRVVEAYFKRLFASEDVGYQLQEMTEIAPVVTEQMNEGLIGPVSVEEVKKAVFDINPSK